MLWILLWRRDKIQTTRLSSGHTVISRLETTMSDQNYICYYYTTHSGQYVQGINYKVVDN